LRTATIIAPHKRKIRDAYWLTNLWLAGPDGKRLSPAFEPIEVAAHSIAFELAFEVPDQPEGCGIGPHDPSVSQLHRRSIRP